MFLPSRKIIVDAWTPFLDKEDLARAAAILYVLLTVKNKTAASYISMHSQGIARPDHQSMAVVFRYCTDMLTDSALEGRTILEVKICPSTWHAYFWLLCASLHPGKFVWGELFWLTSATYMFLVSARRLRFFSWIIRTIDIAAITAHMVANR